MTLTVPAHVVWRDVPGDLAVFDSARDAYHALNGSAAAIWREIAAGADEGTAADRLARTYGAPRAQIADDVAAFVSEALGKGLLVRSPA